MSLKSQDLHYIEQKLGITPEIAKLLTEVPQDTEFPITEKQYVANSVYFNYLAIKKEINYHLLSPKTPPDGKKSQYFLVLAGFYFNSVKPEIFSLDFKSEISKGFRPNQISGHVDDWIYILREIYHKKWLE